MTLPRRFAAPAVGALTLLLAAFAVPGQGAPREEPAGAAAELGAWAPVLPPIEGERHLKNVRQLVSDGTHAEAYFAPDGQRLILQAVRPGDAADQIYILDLRTGKLDRVSTGKGKCTCAYFLPDGRFLYSSTHHHGDEPPPPPDRSKGYIWPLYRTFDVFVCDPARGSLTQIVDNDGYDAETTVSEDGKRAIFTSHRDGGIGLYSMNLDGTDVRHVQLPSGYSGGAFFSPDGQWIVYRAFYPRTKEETTEFERLLSERTLHPVNLEIYVARPDGAEERAVTKNGKVNFAPIFTRDQKRVLFTSDVEAKRRGSYSLYLTGADGAGLERVTLSEGFDGFPHFSRDGRHLVWISDRNAKRPHELNVFLADWVD
ncbi:MAG: PD40 domain-containing protein [Planctomycetes bacterium]|nr:PD40 domain-containing protein [Planctomycetota bacterium]